MQTVNAQDVNLDAQGNAPVELPNVISAGSEVAMIPLRHLVASPYNQRKKPRTVETVAEFADNIRAVGLLQNLVVHAIKKRAKKAQTYGVDAGETRRQGLLANVERGDITLDYLVPCKVISEADAILYSATENDMRKPPHPADQFLAYKALADEGRSAEFIGAIFKVTPKTVAGHLKLASVSTKLFDLFADDQISLAQIQALSITDDHAAQEAAWFGAKDAWNRSPQELRARLKRDKLALSDRVVRFVTVEAYEAAGGKVERDLFSTGDEGSILDSDLLMRLFDEKMAVEHAKLVAQDWSWVETRARFDHDEQRQFTKLYAEPEPLAGEQLAHFQALQLRYEEVSGKLEAHYDAEDGDAECLTDELAEQLQDEETRLETQIGEIEERDGVFTPEQKKVSGAVVTVNYNGDMVICCGLVRAEDREDARSMMQGAGVELPQSLTKKPKGVHSEKLLLDLTAHRTAAVQNALVVDPQIALVTLVHRLALTHIYSGHGQSVLSAVQISSNELVHKIDRVAPEIKADARYEALPLSLVACRALMPKNPNDLYAWLLGQSQTVLLNTLAVCTAMSLNGIAANEAANPINAVAGALNLDLSAYWQPTAENYLGRISKDRIVEIVSEVISKDEGTRLSKMKKGEAALAAEKLLAGKNWLPEFMAAGEVNETRYYASDEDGYEDEEGDECNESDEQQRAETDEQSPADAGGTEQDNLTEQVADDLAVTAQKTVESAPWPFPKAVDFVTAQRDDALATSEGVDAAEDAAAHDSEPATDHASAPIAWPFPQVNTTRLRALSHAA